MPSGTLVNLKELVQTVVDTEVAANISVQAAADAAQVSIGAQTAAEEAVVEANAAASTAEGFKNTAGNSAVSAAASAVTADGHAQNAASAIPTVNNLKLLAEEARDVAILVRSQVEGLLDQFDDRYLGPKATDPLVDNDGDALIEGALYWNTIDKKVMIFNSVVWIDITASTGAVLLVNNLGDLLDKAVARTNLDVYSKDETDLAVSTAIASVIDSSPTTLDTLNELAAALGDDPNFATTITTLIGTKVSKSGDTMTGNLTVPNLIVTGNVDGRDVSVDGTKLDTIETNAKDDQTASEIETLYEGQPDTNKYTDVAKTKVDFISITESVDLDELKADHVALNERFADTNEPTGFLREFPLTTGVIELSPDGTKIISVDWNGVTSVRTNGLFYDGSVAQARQFAIHPVKVSDGGDGAYYVYVEGVKYKIEVTQKTTLENTTGLKFVYHDIGGTLGVANSFVFDYFEDRPITCTVYGNALTQELVNFGDERHGIQMDGFTHRYLHFTQGAQYISGMEIQGLVGGSTTYTQIISGFAYDEDIYMTPPQQSAAPHLYLEGTNWRVEDDGVTIGLLVGGVAKYNLNTAGTYSLASVTGNDAMIVFFCLTNNREFPYAKILGQSVYTTVNAARADISNALVSITLAGLPSPEFLPIGAVIINASGEAQLLADGTMYYDLRKVKFIGSGSQSGTSQYHADLLGRDVASSHPASAINVAANGNLSAGTVQSVLENLIIDTEW